MTFLIAKETGIVDDVICPCHSVQTIDFLFHFEPNDYASVVFAAAVFSFLGLHECRFVFNLCLKIINLGR